MSSTSRPRLALVAAVAANGVMGRDGRLPWHLSADLKHFKAVTLGKRIVMGRRTWESLPKLLPDREHVLVSSSAIVLPPGVIIVRTLGDALALPAPTDPVCIVGGSALYREALPMVDDLYLTEIEADVDGDTRFPDWDRSLFRELSRDRQSAPLQPGGEPVDFSFVHYVRR